MGFEKLFRSIAERLRGGASAGGGMTLGPLPPEVLSARRLASDREELAKLRAGANWSGSLTWMNLLGSEDEGVRSEAAELIARLVERMPVEALPGFDSRTRESYLTLMHWHEMPVAEAVSRQWPLPVWGLFTMHPSGYVREAALRRIAGEPRTALPFLLLRLNDWVAPVREFAESLVRRLLVPESIASWAPLTGMLPLLHERKRNDHAWLDEGVSRLFLSKEGRPALEHAARSPSRAVARWAVRTAMGLPAEERGAFIGIALSHHDPVLRVRAAEMVRSWKECPRREQLLERARRDRFMGVRRQALYAALDAPPAERHAHLKGALLDARPMMRHAARVYLREDAERGAGAVDLRAFYLDVIVRGVEPRAAAVAGLGETGSGEDVALLERLAAVERAACAGAAVGGVAAIDPAGHAEWFVRLLHDERIAVAKAAARALVAMGGGAPFDGVREAMLKGERGHTRRFALRVLLRRADHDAVTDALRGAADGDEATARTATWFLDGFGRRVSSRGPTEAQCAAAAAAMERAGGVLPERLRRAVAARMNMKSEA